MTLVRFKNQPVPSAFNNLVSDFFPEIASLYKGNGSNTQRFVPVNVVKKEQEYVLEVVAPGLDKDDFKISLENDILTVSAEKKNETTEQNEKLVRREYSFTSFKRSFTLDDQIDAENIAAKYINGVLTLNLPVKAEVKSTKEISVQ
jgi:HSP20 family protein